MKTLFFFIVLFLVNSKSFSQEVSNVSYEAFQDSIVVYYDLKGETDQEYNVSLILRREEYITFQFIAKNVRGDVGEGKFVGEKRKIIWDVKKDFIINPDVTDYYFEVKASTVSRSAVWYYVAAAAVLGGGAAAILLLRKKETGITIPNPIGAPPIRPFKY